MPCKPVGGGANYIVYFHCITFPHSLIKFSGGLDLVLLPGVAFTKQCGRCGHGMGYYDKFLERLFASGCTRDRVKLIGVSFREQIVDESDLPLDHNDVVLDQVIISED